MRSNQNLTSGRGLRPLFARLTRGGAGWLLVAAACFALVGGATLYSSQEDIIYSRSGYFGALKEEFEETKGANKGLEAFVLSELGAGVATMFHENNVTEGFIAAFNNLEGELKPSRPQGKSGATSTRTPKKSLDLEVIPAREPDLPLTAKYLTNKDGQGFLFMPGAAMGAWVPADATDKGIIDTVERNGGALRKVILDSKKVAPFLNLLRETEVVVGRGNEQTLIERKPVQTYFLTSTGLIRIDGRDVRNYRPQFAPHTFFPERPYFWATIDPFRGADDLKQGKQYQLDQAFKTTKPYIDYGGNGIVVTLSRPVKGAAVQSGLFLDFVLGEYAKKEIIKKIEKLHGSWDELSWVAREPEPEVKPEKGRMPEIAQNILKADIIRWKSNLAEISGKLHLISSKGGVVEFTIPIPVPPAAPGNADAQPQPNSGRLLYCKLDLDGFQQRVLRNVIIIASSLALSAFCVVMSVFYSRRERKKQEAEAHWKLEEQEAEARRKQEEQKVDDARRLEEQRKALECFGQVMSRAPVAYCRVGEDDKFIEMNEEFADLLGYESPGAARESLFNKQTFQSLLDDDESRREYEYIQEMRRNWRQTRPYPVRLRGKDRVVAVNVYGASVPMPKSHLDAVPQTFGILTEEGASSYKMTVAPVFGKPQKPSVHGDLFVLMKFESEFDKVYKSIEDVAERLKLVATRADKFLSPRDVMDDVWASINAADLIIADCTGLNPNVFYEIGLAHAVGKPVVFLTQNDKEFPFDVARFRHIVYELETGQGLKQFEENLKRSLQSELGLDEG